MKGKDMRYKVKLLLVIYLLLLFTCGEGLRATPVEDSITDGLTNRVTEEVARHVASKEKTNKDLLVETYATGSSLPDCSHACGPCFPCKRVMVSFKCSIAESCPIVYRCMCRGKYYHVPSN